MQSKKTLWDSLYLGIYDILSNRIVKTNENEDPDVVAKWASREFADVLADSVESFINTGGINLDSVEELINYFSNGSANSAVKLKDTHTFWGQPFNGTQDVLGDLKNVGKISASGNISTLGGVSAGGSSDLFELFSSGYTSITEVGTGNGVAFIESDVASIKVHKANFLTEHQSLSAYYTSSEIDILLSTKVAIEDLSQSILDVTDPLYLKLSGGNLTGPLSGTTASFTGNIHSDLNISANGGVSAGGITDLIETTPIIDLYRSWSDSTPTNKALEATLGVELHNSIVSLESISHTHPNKSIIDNTTASFLEEDKSKLQGIAYNANNYSLPIATDLVLGGVKIGSNIDILSGVISVKDASTTVKGLVQLSDSVNSASSSSAATSKAVKIAWDLANSKWAWNEDTIKGVVVNRSLTADKLTAPISLWGQLFDGSSDINGDLHSIGNISADGGVSAGGIGDLSEAITSGYNDILPHPDNMGNAVTSITSNGGSTIYYRMEKSFSEVGHNHNTAYSLLGHVHDDRYYTEVEISDIFSGLTSVTGYNKSNWDTAYSWGNHASEGYALASALSTHIADVSNPHSVTKLQVGLGNVEDTKLSTWAGTTNITTLGTISDGTWQGNIIGVLYGGTGKNSIAINKMLYASSANVFSEIPTTSFGRGLLNTASGTVIVGLNADLLDGLHGIDFVNVASTQEITGSKTFTKTLNILESLNVSSNIHAGGNISADGGISAGGISDLLETGSSGFNDIEYIGTGNVVTNVEKNVSSLKVFRGFSVYTDIEIDTKFSTEITNRNTAISDAINLLDVASVGGAGKYISAISEANGKISATASDMPTLLSQFTDNLGSSPVHTHSQYMLASLKGAANGVAELGSNGLILASQLPSYVDDVLTYNSLSIFPSTGESGKIYIANDTNITYRWSGTAYVEISKSLALGENDSTAYRGDRGKISYDHSQASHTFSIAGQNINALGGSISKASLLSALNVADGAQVNILEGVKLNNVALTPTFKIVNVNACTSITVPTGLSVEALTASGLIVINLATGYVIPTTQSITDINTNISNHDACIGALAGQVLSLQAKNQYDELFAEYINARTISSELFVGYLKGNADTSTKLYTARTLWGQSFDGTANVSGNMIGVGSLDASGDIRTSERIYGAKGVFSGGIADLGGTISSGYNLISTTGSGNAVTSVDDNGSTLNIHKDITFAVASDVTNSLATKVDKVTGYGLSKNDLTDVLLSALNANTAARHSHSNKSLLDSYTQTESDLASAVSLKHTHSNKAVLDATTASFLTADKTKLNGIATGANLYVHPVYIAQASGLYKFTVDSLGHVSAVVAVAKSDITALGIPAQDTVYVHPSSGVTAGTYRSVTVDVNGHVTTGTNPTTLAGYGITDAASTSALSTLDANIDACIGSLAGQVLTLQSKNQYDELFAEYINARTISSELFVGYLKGNADTATAFQSAKSITLTGDIKGTASSTGGWSIATVIDTGKVTNAMLAGSIDNSKLVNSLITIAGTTVSLGSSISAATLRSNLSISNVQNTAFYQRIAYVNGGIYAMAGTNTADAFSIYAPTAAGTSGQLLVSSGGTPSWVSQGSGGGIDADKLDNMHAVDFVNIASVQTITGLKTFSAAVSMLNSLSVANNINAGGIIQGVGGVFAGGIADLGGSEYSIPAASASNIGGIKIGYTNNYKNYKVQLDTSGNAFVNVPWTDTTYALGSAAYTDSSAYAAATHYHSQYLEELSWITPTLTNGTQGTTYGTVRYRLIGTNVQIDGSFVITWDGSSQLRLFNLPSGYNPTHNMTGWLYNNSNGIWRYVIGTDGWVTLINVKSVTGGSNITTATTCMFDKCIFPRN